MWHGPCPSSVTPQGLTHLGLQIQLKSKALLKHFIVELKAFSNGGSAHSSPVSFSAKPPFHLARPMSHVLVLEADVSRLFLVTLLDN